MRARGPRRDRLGGRDVHDELEAHAARARGPVRRRGADLHGRAAGARAPRARPASLRAVQGRAGAPRGGQGLGAATRPDAGGQGDCRGRPRRWTRRGTRGRRTTSAAASRAPRRASPSTRRSSASGRSSPQRPKSFRSPPPSGRAGSGSPADDRARYLLGEPAGERLVADGLARACVMPIARSQGACASLASMCARPRSIRRCAVLRAVAPKPAVDRGGGDLHEHALLDQPLEPLRLALHLEAPLRVGEHDREAADLEVEERLVEVDRPAVVRAARAGGSAGFPPRPKRRSASSSSSASISNATSPPVRSSSGISASAIAARSSATSRSICAGLGRPVGAHVRGRGERRDRRPRRPRGPSRARSQGCRPRRRYRGGCGSAGRSRDDQRRGLAGAESRVATLTANIERGTVAQLLCAQPFARS